MTLLLLLACHGTPDPEGVPLAPIVQPEGVTTYTAWFQTPDGEYEEFTTETRALVEDDVKCFGQNIEVWTAAAGATTGTKACLTEREYSHYGFHDGSGWTVYQHKTELRDGMVVGDTWDREHQSGGATNHRECRVEKTPFCKDGVATSCTTRWDASLVWLRQHWCPGSGWRGMEGRVWRDGVLELTTWSSGVAHDGVDQDDVRLSRRPFAVVD